ncbi:hypothetical protein, partial [Nocardia sp. CC227C]|uniref:hypothetical protein n=1 Tax=Nocardia sp. CC227C TaxID=3044562 RepID=UPI00278BC898
MAGGTRGRGTGETDGMLGMSANGEVPPRAVALMVAAALVLTFAVLGGNPLTWFEGSHGRSEESPVSPAS